VRDDLALRFLAVGNVAFRRHLAHVAVVACAHVRDCRQLHELLVDVIGAIADVTGDERAPAGGGLPLEGLRRQRGIDSIPLEELPRVADLRGGVLVLLPPRR
jgi:hypothetical protein